mgnify:CR=1 FL=1
MGWIKISDFNTGKPIYPKNSIFVRPGEEAPKGYSFQYNTRISAGQYRASEVERGQTITDSKQVTDDLDLEVEVWAKN